MSLKPILEALFFATDEPLSIQRLEEVIPEVGGEEISRQLEAWKSELEQDKNRGLQVVEVAGGYLLATKPDQAECVDRLLERRKKRTLSQAALETLAVLAYRQPMTRAEIEAIRGVNVDSMVHTLLQRRLIKIAGRKDVPGHPFMYRTTKQFLHHFGLRSLEELPRIEELSQALADAEGEEDPNGNEQLPSIPVDLPDQEDFQNLESDEDPR